MNTGSEASPSVRHFEVFSQLFGVFRLVFAQQTRHSVVEGQRQAGAVRFLLDPLLSSQQFDLLLSLLHDL